MLVFGGLIYKIIECFQPKGLPGKEIHHRLCCAHTIQHGTMTIHRQGAGTPNGEFIDGGWIQRTWAIYKVRVKDFLGFNPVKFL